MSKSKKLYMNEHQLQLAFEKFKNEPAIQKALTLGWLIFLRPNGFITVDPEALREHEVKGKIKKPYFNKARIKKIEDNYCLYH